ncbi:MAG: patatin family protein [Clostridia bacterium]|nr:patatin family protein [Clostridia bacterium]
MENRTVKQIGLVLEGGGMRGLFTAGVIDVMMEQGIDFEALVGVSAGACFGCNYKSKQPGRVLRYNLAYCKDPRYCSLRSLWKTGNLFGTEFCYYELPDRLDLFDVKTFEENPMDFHMVCTDVETGKPVYHLCKSTRATNEMEWMRASSSLPLVSRMVEIDGMKLMDGGIADSIPIRFSEKMGYQKNVVVLTQPEGYVKKPASMMGLIRWQFRKYPAFIDAMMRRHEMYNDTIDYIRKQEAAGQVFVIRPQQALPVGRIEHNPEKLEQAYQMGRDAAIEALPALQKFMID